MKFSSELALRVYRQVFLGIDKPLGYTIDEETGQSKAVDIPDGAAWYVQHADYQLPDSYVGTLAAEVKSKAVPGLSFASCHEITRQGIEQLKGLGHLEILDLFNTHADDGAMETVAGLSGLKSLNLAGTEITDKGVRLIAGLPQLERLHLGWTHVTDAGLMALASMKSLRTLVVRNTQITDAGLSHLAGMSGLETLDVQETGVGDQGVANVKALKASLKRLYLGYTAITDAALEDLKSFTPLKTLMLRATHLKRDHDVALKAALPQLGGVDTGPDGIQEGLIR